MFYVYILFSRKRNLLYKGKTSDLKKRILEHNSGHVVSTKSGLPWILIYVQGFVNKIDAAKEERFLKSGKGRERIKLLLTETLKGVKVP